MKILDLREKNFSCERKNFGCERKKNYNRTLGKKRKFIILKIRHVTVRSSLRHKQCDVIGDLCIPKPSRI